MLKPRSVMSVPERTEVQGLASEHKISLRKIGALPHEESEGHSQRKANPR